MLSRFFVENLAAQGYLDISYLALIVWAVVLEVQRPPGNARVPVLAAAGLLRPDAWVLSGAYWLWCSWPADNRTRPKYLALAAIAPSCGSRSTPSSRATRCTRCTPPPYWRKNWNAPGPLQRAQSVWNYCVRIDKLPVLLGGLVGVPLAVWLAPRRVLAPLAALILLDGVFVAEGAAGASVDRPLHDRRRHHAAALLRRLDRRLGDARPAVGVAARVDRRSRRVGAFRRRRRGQEHQLLQPASTLAQREDFHVGLAHALADRGVKAQLRRCPLLSLPDNKLIPDARWILDTAGQHDIVARSEARADVAKGSHTLEDRIRAGSVAVYPLGSAVFVEAIADVGDDPRDQVPLAGFKRIYTSTYYAVYGNC